MNMIWILFSQSFSLFYVLFLCFLFFFCNFFSSSPLLLSFSPNLYLSHISNYRFITTWYQSITFRRPYRRSRMDLMDVFLEKLCCTMPPLKELQEAPKYKIIWSLISFFVQEVYGKWRKNLCECCDEHVGEAGGARF